MSNLYQADDELFITNMSSYQCYYSVDTFWIDNDEAKMDIVFQKTFFSKKEIDILISLEKQQIDLYLEALEPITKRGQIYNMLFNVFVNHITIGTESIRYSILYKQEFAKYEPEIKSKIRKLKIKNILDG